MELSKGEYAKTTRKAIHKVREAPRATKFGDKVLREKSIVHNLQMITPDTFKFTCFDERTIPSRPTSSTKLGLKLSIKPRLNRFYRIEGENILTENSANISR
jgi:hypothetical protein